MTPYALPPPVPAPRRPPGFPWWGWVLLLFGVLLLVSFAGCVACSRVLKGPQADAKKRREIVRACVTVSPLDEAGSRAALETLEKKVCKSTLGLSSCDDWFNRVTAVCKSGTRYTVLTNTTRSDYAVREEICDGLRYELSMSDPIAVTCFSIGCSTTCGRPTPRRSR